MAENIVLPNEEKRLASKTSPGNQTSKHKISYTKSQFMIHSYHTEINDQIISFHNIKMDGSLFMWIGKELDPSFTDLSLGMISPFQTTPLASKVVGSSIETSSTNLSSRLAKKLNKQVFVSCNIPLDQLSLPIIEKRVTEEILQNFDLF